MPIMTVRTTRGREKTVVDTMKAEVDNEGHEISAILYPEDLKGYVFVEGDEASIRTLIQDMRHVKGLIDQEVEIDELEKFLSNEPQEITIEAGDTVEVIGGPFKGEDAEIERIDEANQEATIKLLEAAVPIPVTISVELLRKRSEE